jgi:hypothetical protein
MPRRKKVRGTETTAGYFKTIVRENPSVLKTKSNDEIMGRWMTDHPGHSDRDLKKARANWANLKSLLRKQERKRRRGAAAGAPVAANQGMRVGRSLDALEESIDDCLTQAKVMDRQGLESIIKLLRRARNEVVWKMGQ